MKKKKGSVSNLRRLYEMRSCVTGRYSMWIATHDEKCRRFRRGSLWFICPLPPPVAFSLLSVMLLQRCFSSDYGQQRSWCGDAARSRSCRPGGARTEEADGAALHAQHPCVRVRRDLRLHALQRNLGKHRDSRAAVQHIQRARAAVLRYWRCSSSSFFSPDTGFPTFSF